MPQEIEEAGLLAAVEDAGEAPPSNDQLKGWRRAGLIPRPRIEHAKGIRGSRAWYPAWAADQLIAVVRLHRDVHRLQDLRIALWWAGHWVEPEKLRSALIVPLERLSQEVKDATAGAIDPYEAADAILAAMRHAGAHSSAATLFRTRLSKRTDLMDLLWTLLVIGMGGTAPWDEEDRSRPDPAPGALHLVATAFGIDRAMSENPMGSKPWLPANFDLRGFMAELRDAGGFELADPARPIREATDAQLAQARADAQMFSQSLAMVISTIEGLLGREIPALGGLSAMRGTTSADRAAMIRNMLILRALVSNEAFSEMNQLIEQVRDRFDAIAQLRAALPQHESALRFDFAEQLTAMPPAEAIRVRQDVADFLEQHPQVADALHDRDQAA